MSERWLPTHVDGYEVSDMGRVRSTKMSREPKVLKQTNRGDGRLYVTLYGPDGGRRTLVHRLMMAAFVGPCPEGFQVCHNNGNPMDNRLENLRYDTPTNNQRDRLLHGTHSRGERHGMHKLTQGDVLEIRDRYRRGGVTLMELGKAYGVHFATIGRVASGDAWGWLDA